MYICEYSEILITFYWSKTIPTLLLTFRDWHSASHGHFYWPVKKLQWLKNNKKK